MSQTEGQRKLMGMVFNNCHTELHFLPNESNILYNIMRNQTDKTSYGLDCKIR